MANLTRRTTNDGWSPFRELDDFSDRLSRFFGREPLASGMADWTPRANVFEKPDRYEIQAELPRVARDDVKVVCENGVLTLSGERRYEKEDKGDGNKVHRIESAYGSFMRSFVLPQDADAENVEAKYDNGMLDITIPRVAARKGNGTKQIPIK